MKTVNRMQRPLALKQPYVLLASKIGYVLLVLTALVFCTSCETANFDADAARSTAPTVVYYTPDRLQQAEAELQECDSPVLEGMMIDYGVMRDEARVLMGQPAVFTSK